MMFQQVQDVDVRDWFDEELQRKILKCLSVFFPQPVTFTTIANQLNISNQFEFKLYKNINYLMGHNLVLHCGNVFENGGWQLVPQYQITSIGLDNVIKPADYFYTNVVATTSFT